MHYISRPRAKMNAIVSNGLITFNLKHTYRIEYSPNLFRL